MNEISLINLSGELRADSRTFAPKMDIRHRQLMDNIRKYASKFEELGLLPFQSEAVEEDGARGIKYQQYALLNEDQAYFLLTLSRNTDAVVSAKLALVKARDGDSEQVGCNYTDDGQRRRWDAQRAHRETVGA